MDNTTCAVDGCLKPIKRAGYCYGHYMKTWRYGTPTPQHAQRWADLSGVVFGQLVALRRIGGAASYWECRCSCGSLVLVRTGDLNRGSTQSCGGTCRPVAVPRSDGCGYWGAHSRVRVDRGSASSHACVDCGVTAYQWSYNHADPDERLSQDAATCGMPFSLDPVNYDPRCVTCHKAFDATRPTLGR